MYTVYQPHRGIMTEEELVYTAHPICQSASTQLSSTPIEVLTSHHSTVGKTDDVPTRDEPLPVAGRGEMLPILEVPLYIPCTRRDYLLTLLADNGANMNLMHEKTAVDEISSVVKLSAPYPATLSTANGIANYVARQCTIRFKTPLGKYFEVAFQTHVSEIRASQIMCVTGSSGPARAWGHVKS